MSDIKGKKLIAIPDYLTGFQDETVSFFGAYLVGCSSKLPEALKKLSYYDAEKEADRSGLMMLVENVEELTLLTPSASFYKRLSEMRDDCFFTDLTLRLCARDAYVTVITGMREDRIIKPVRKYIDELRDWNVKMVFDKAEELAAPDIELVLASDVAKAASMGIKEITAGKNAIVTPYAWDEAKDRGVVIRKRT